MEAALRVAVAHWAAMAVTAAADAEEPVEAVMAEAQRAFCAAPLQLRPIDVPVPVAAALRVAARESDAARGAALLACACRAGRAAADAARSPRDRRAAGARARVCAALAAWLQSVGLTRRGARALLRLCAAPAPPLPPAPPSWAQLALQAARAERRALARAMRRGMGWLTRFEDVRLEGRDATRALVAAGLQPYDSAPLLALMGTTAADGEEEEGPLVVMMLPVDALDAFEAASGGGEEDGGGVQ
jgi:hypothetical protein